MKMSQYTGGGGKRLHYQKCVAHAVVQNTLVWPKRWSFLMTVLTAINILKLESRVLG
jgi:hypothetical protein